MSRKQRSKSWRSHGISAWRKKQIMAFCRQYDEWQEKLEYGLKAIVMDGMPHGNSVSRPTEQQAERNLVFLQNIALVDNAIRAVCPQIFDQMLESVARGVSFLDLDVPYSQADFYSLRIEVYAKINEKM